MNGVGELSKVIGDGVKEMDNTHHTLRSRERKRRSVPQLAKRQITRQSRLRRRARQHGGAWSATGTHGHARVARRTKLTKPRAQNYQRICVTSAACSYAGSAKRTLRVHLVAARIGVNYRPNLVKGMLHTAAVCTLKAGLAFWIDSKDGEWHSTLPE